MINLHTPDPHPTCGIEDDQVATNAPGGRKNKVRNTSNIKNSLATTYATMIATVSTPKKSTKTFRKQVKRSGRGHHIANIALIV